MAINISRPEAGPLGHKFHPLDSASGSQPRFDRPAWAAGSPLLNEVFDGIALRLGLLAEQEKLIRQLNLNCAFDALAEGRLPPHGGLDPAPEAAASAMVEQLDQYSQILEQLPEFNAEPLTRRKLMQKLELKIAKGLANRLETIEKQISDKVDEALELEIKRGYEMLLEVPEWLELKILEITGLINKSKNEIAGLPFLEKTRGQLTLGAVMGAGGQGRPELARALFERQTPLLADHWRGPIAQRVEFYVFTGYIQAERADLMNAKCLEELVQKAVLKGLVSPENKSAVYGLAAEAARLADASKAIKDREDKKRLAEELLEMVWDGADGEKILADMVGDHDHALFWLKLREKETCGGFDNSHWAIGRALNLLAAQHLYENKLEDLGQLIDLAAKEDPESNTWSRAELKKWQGRISLHNQLNETDGQQNYYIKALTSIADFLGLSKDFDDDCRYHHFKKELTKAIFDRDINAFDPSVLDLKELVGKQLFGAQ